jgi:hypothetical protein
MQGFHLPLKKLLVLVYGTVAAALIAGLWLLY